MTRTADFETKRHAFYILRVGCSLLQKQTNKEVYFQPGDDTAYAVEQAEHCFDGEEMYPGEAAKVFDLWASEYFQY